ncbi:hypothetical protein PUN28_002025 [Cardiocondyla obscurior]|uniref:Uncharacterized protein n=1 Tax=Cardiocondyla obscurior TaxID=286306 RepID=A0AAW2GS74_9HYME
MLYVHHEIILSQPGATISISDCRENLCFLALPLFFNSTEGKVYGSKIELPPLMSVSVSLLLFSHFSPLRPRHSTAEGRNRSSLLEQRWNVKGGTSVGVSWYKRTREAKTVKTPANKVENRKTEIYGKLVWGKKKTEKKEKEKQQAWNILSKKEEEETQRCGNNRRIERGGGTYQTLWKKEKKKKKKNAKAREKRKWKEKGVTGR